MLPVGRDDSAFHIRLSLEGEFLLAHVAALEGRGVLRETSTSAIAFEVKPEPDRLSVGRGLAIFVDGIEGANRGEAQGFADLAGLTSLAEHMTRQILARCGMMQVARKPARGLPRALADAPRIGIELGSTSLHVSDGRPLPLTTKGWTLALTLPGEVQGAEWMDGRGDRHVAIGDTERSTWAMSDVLDPDTDADAGMLALAIRRVVHGLAEELAAPASARVAYAVPDSIDEFSQRSIRGAVGASFSRAVPVWRSVAAAMAWGSSPTLLPRGPRSGDPIVVVDTEFAAATITVLVARQDDKVERLHPSSRGIYWERRPPLPPDEQLDMLGWSHVLHAYAQSSSQWIPSF